MNSALLSIDSVRAKAASSFKEAGVVRAFVFGSVARGEQKEGSDIDLLIEFPEGKTLLDLVDLKLKLEEIFGVRVDLVTPRAISPRLRPFIQSELVSIL